MCGEGDGRWTVCYEKEWEDKQNFAVDVCGQLLLTYQKNIFRTGRTVR
jgi:hypothetical protein